MEGPSSAARRRRNLYLPLVAAIALFVAAVALTPRHETTPVELQALRGGHSGDDDDDDGASSDKHTSSHKPSDDGGDDGNDGASAHHAGHRRRPSQPAPGNESDGGCGPAGHAQRR